MADSIAKKHNGVAVNGTGNVQEISLSTESIKDKLKADMKGFGIISKNDATDMNGDICEQSAEQDDIHAVESNGANSNGGSDVDANNSMKDDSVCTLEKPKSPSNETDKINVSNDTSEDHKEAKIKSSNITSELDKPDEKNDSTAEGSLEQKSKSLQKVLEEIPKPSQNIQTPKQDKKPSKVDRMLANDKGPSSSLSETENLRPFAKLLFDLGLDLTRQQVYKDLIKVQTKKDEHNKLNDKEKVQLDKLKDAYKHLVDKNDSFIPEMKKCSRCNYKSDSLNALELHKEFDHKGACSLCDFVTANASAFYFHMEAEHNRQGRIEPILGMFACPYCPYEHHSAKKNYQKHLVKCEKSFDLKRNLQPIPADCDIPLKPVAPAAKLAQQNARKPPQLLKKPEAVTQGSILRNTPAAMGILKQSNITQNTSPQALPSWLNVQENQGAQLIQMGGQYFLVVTQNGQTFMTPMTTGPVTAAGAAPSVNTPSPSPLQAKATGKSIPDANQKIASKGSFEICEICGGFVKDRDSLRIHFFWAHKIEIHPSLMKSKDPVLKCNNKNCTRRYWTYQGYQRHITVAHKGDAGKAPSPGMTCYVCGIHTIDFITHMTAKHPQVVKHMLSQMRCVVCQDALPTETALESHMFIEHKDVVTKYGSLVGGSSKNSGKTPPEVGASTSESQAPKVSNQEASIQCSRCDLDFKSAVAYNKHFSDVHGKDIEPCSVCKEDIKVGKPLIDHMEKNHVKKLSIPLRRLADNVILEHQGKGSQTKKRRNSDDVIVIDLDERKRQKLDDQNVNDNSSNIDDDAPNSNKKYIEEIIDVDGEQVVIQKMME